MKKLNFLTQCICALALGWVLLPTACGPADQIPLGEALEVTAPFGSEVLLPLNGTAEPLIFALEAKMPWKIELVYEGKARDYVQASPSSGGSGMHTIRLVVSPNDGDQARACTLRLVALRNEGEEVEELRLRQEGVALDFPAFVQDLDTLYIDPAGDHGEIVLSRANINWKVETDASWIEVSPNEGKPFNVDPNALDAGLSQTVTWTALSNPSATQGRKAHITFSAGQNFRYTVVAVQDVKPKPQIALMKKNGTPVTETGMGYHVQFTSPAAEKDYNIKANCLWTVSFDQDWIRMEPASGGGGETPVKLCAKVNPSDKIRKAVCTLKCDGEVLAQYTISQVYAFFSNTPLGTFDFGPQAITNQPITGLASTSLITNSNEMEVTASVTQGEEWLTCTMDQGVVCISLTDHSSGNQIREGLISLESGELTRILTVRQNYRIEPQIKFVNSVGEEHGTSVGAGSWDLSGYLRTNFDWTFHSNQAWITMRTPASQSGGAGETAVTIRFGTNPTDIPREGTVTFKCGDEVMATYVYNQAGGELIGHTDFGPIGTFDFGPQAITDEFIVWGHDIFSRIKSTNWMTVRPTVTQGNEWIQCRIDDYDRLRITLTANTGDQVREGKITLKSGEVTRVLTVRQNYKDEPQISFVTVKGEEPILNSIPASIPVSSSRVNYYVRTNRPWTASFNPDYGYNIYSSASGPAGQTRITIQYRSNPSSEQRKSTLIFRSGEEVLGEYEIIQEGAQP